MNMDIGAVKMGDEISLNPTQPDIVISRDIHGLLKARHSTIATTFLCK